MCIYIYTFDIHFSRKFHFTRIQIPSSSENRTQHYPILSFSYPLNNSSIRNLKKKKKNKNISRSENSIEAFSNKSITSWFPICEEDLYREIHFLPITFKIISSAENGILTSLFRDVHTIDGRRPWSPIRSMR